jgi:hypothetical protein
MRNVRLTSLGVSAAVAPGGERSVLERPPPGLARGTHVVPGALVIGVALSLVLATLGYYLLRWRRARRR